MKQSVVQRTRPQVVHALTDLIELDQPLGDDKPPGSKHPRLPQSQQLTENIRKTEEKPLDRIDLETTARRRKVRMK